MYAYPVGTQVEKPKGYPFPGTVVAAFDTLAGETRYVVESALAPGMLHIFSGSQLIKRQDEHKALFMAQRALLGGPGQLQRPGS